MTRIVGAGPVVAVDDDEVEIMMMSRCYQRSVLRDVHQLVTFSSGVSFLDYMDSVERGERPMPAIVLLDINMPNLDGLQVLRSLRSRHAFGDLPPVVFVSSTRDPADLDACRQLGAPLRTKFSEISEGVDFLASLAA